MQRACRTTVGGDAWLRPMPGGGRLSRRRQHQQLSQWPGSCGCSRPDVFDRLERFDEAELRFAPIVEHGAGFRRRSFRSVGGVNEDVVFDVGPEILGEAVDQREDEFGKGILAVGPRVDFRP